MEETYFIKPDYRPNLAQNSYDTQADESYWNADRLRMAARFQYDVYETVIRLARARRATTLLDVGSGPPQKLKQLLAPGKLRVHLVDQPSVRPHALRLLPEARFTPCDLESADLDLGEFYDLIVCADVIEHLVYPDACLRFIHRHLATQGLLVISTPERDVLRGTRCTNSPHPMHVREWNMVEFRRYLESRALAVLEHRLVAQQRVSALTRAWGRLLNSIGVPPAWHSCQLAVCVKA
jgi:2-polyprenyl-3-methyl-5-hydroxy-6-metoxy-1,4-benzoquinol methylase